MSAAALPVGMDPANWRTHPHSRWAFSHPAAFLPTAGLAAAPEPSDLPRALLAEPPPRWAEIAAETHADGLVVVKEGRLVHEWHAPWAEPSQAHLAFSISKAVTGLVAEMLIADRRIDPDCQAVELSPLLARTPFARATLRALLDMVDGVPFDEDYANPDAAIHHYSKHFWGSGKGGVVAALQALPGSGCKGAAGFSYRTPVTDVIGIAIEGATGADIAEHSRKLWQAAGAGEPGLWVLDTGGRPIASAGFGCTLVDLARLGLLVAEAVRGKGEKGLVSAARSIARGGDQAAFARSGQATRPDYSYRSGWWIDHRRSALNALGVFSQRLHIVPHRQLVIARFGSAPTASNQPSDALHADWFDDIAAAVHG